MSTRPSLRILVKGVRLGYPDFLQTPAIPLQRPNDQIYYQGVGGRPL